jgi:sulfate/thiosulfate transport system permease protein
MAVVPAVTWTTRRAVKRRAVLPGFRLTMGFTLFYLALVVLIPLMTLPARTLSMSGEAFWRTITDPRVVASYRLSVGASLVAAAVNAVFGLIVAWVLVRYTFPGKRLVDSLVDLPFALPTAVAGITLTTIYAPNGPIGELLAPYDIKIAFTRIGVTIALIFIGLPFVVRTLQPVIQDLDPEIEEAATSLGATRFRVLSRVVLPYLYPAWLTGFALSFARAVGEYGSVVFISGNMPMRTEISPLLIITKLEQFDYAGATAIALVMLLISFTLLLIVNALQGWATRRVVAGGIHGRHRSRTPRRTRQRQATPD